LDITTDIAFHKTPLVTAVGNEDSEFLSSVLLDEIKAVIGITIFQFPLLYQTGILLANQPFALDGEKKLLDHQVLYPTTVILLFLLLLIDHEL
jgi:hypothetical protein